MDPVKIGLVGYGFGGRYFHAPLIAAAPECEFMGVVTSSPERRALLAAEHPEVDAFDSLASLAAAGAEAVSISTPADTHSALTDEAIGLGLSVVCDKPFSLDPVAARRSVELASARGVTLSPYQNRRWDSDFLTVRRAGRRRRRWARSTGSSPGSRGTPRSTVPAGRAAAPCSTSVPTSSTRPSPCSARWSRCTPSRGP